MSKSLWMALRFIALSCVKKMPFKCLWPSFIAGKSISISLYFPSPWKVAFRFSYNSNAFFNILVVKSIAVILSSGIWFISSKAKRPVSVLRSQTLTSFLSVKLALSCLTTSMRFWWYWELSRPHCAVICLRTSASLPARASATVSPPPDA